MRSVDIDQIVSDVRAVAGVVEANHNCCYGGGKNSDLARRLLGTVAIPALDTVVDMAALGTVVRWVLIISEQEARSRALDGPERCAHEAALRLDTTLRASREVWQVSETA